MRKIMGLVVLVVLACWGAKALASNQVASHCGSQGCTEFYSDGHNYYVFYLGLDGARIFSAELPMSKSERTLERHEMRLVAVEQIQYLGSVEDGGISKTGKCGADGWGWDMGDMTFSIITTFPDGSVMRQTGTYTGGGRQMITTTVQNPEGGPAGPPQIAYNQPATEAENTPGDCREEEKPL